MCASDFSGRQHTVYSSFVALNAGSGCLQRLLDSHTHGDCVHLNVFVQNMLV